MSPDSLRKVLSYLAGIVILATLFAAIQATIGTSGERMIAIILISFSIGVMASMGTMWLHKPDSYAVYLTPEQVADIQERLNAAENPLAGAEEGEAEESAHCVGFSQVQSEETEEEDT